MIELTIKRNDGKVERVEWTKGGMTDKLFGMIQNATKDAGKGDVISWEKVTKAATMGSSADGWCNKCESYCYGDCQAN